MKSPKMLDQNANELTRAEIRNHINFPGWYAELKPHTQQVIDFILKQNLTVKFVLSAQEERNEEWKGFQFLQMIRGGNPDPTLMPILTHFALTDILSYVENFGKIKK